MYKTWESQRSKMFETFRCRLGFPKFMAPPLLFLDASTKEMDLMIMKWLFHLPTHFKANLCVHGVTDPVTTSHLSNGIFCDHSPHVFLQNWYYIFVVYIAHQPAWWLHKAIDQTVSTSLSYLLRSNKNDNIGHQENLFAEQLQVFQVFCIHLCQQIVVLLRQWVSSLQKLFAQGIVCLFLL